MDLRAIASAAAKLGMGLAGTAREAVTLNLGAPGDYDPATDVTAAGSVPVQVLALPFKRRNRQAPEDVSANTETMLIDAGDLPAGAQITEEDTVTRTSGRWQIVSVENPASALWLLDIRR